MRKTKIALIAAYLIPSLLFPACSDEENKAPTIDIVYPTNGAILKKGDIIPVRAIADDEDGSIAEINIYVEGRVMATINTSTLVYNWETAELDLGRYVLSATAEDDKGKSAALNIEVLLDTTGGLNPNLEYGLVTDIEGNSYATIALGNQVWMAENLKASHYADGTPITQISDEAEWNDMTADIQAYCWYNNLTAYSDTSGALYSWAAAMNGSSSSDNIPSGVQGVCPDGWHLPSDAEWKVLEMFLGMSQIDADSHDWRGSDEGGQLKEIGFSLWGFPNYGASNSSGFTAVPGGFRSPKGMYYSFGQVTGFWTSTEETGAVQAWYRMVSLDKAKVYRQFNNMQMGLSVRCVQDAAN